MRARVIRYLKTHPQTVRCFWDVGRVCLQLWGAVVPTQAKTMMFCSFGGRKFDDSPKAIYEEVCSRKEFDDWRLIWAFVEPEKFDIPRGEKVRVDTIAFFQALLSSRVWVSNSGMDRGIELRSRRHLRVETWHGTPLKKIGGEENQNALGGKNVGSKGKPDNSTIRCAQSEFDREIFARVFNADRDAILLSDLPRNDAISRYSDRAVEDIRMKLGIEKGKKVILYTPTYREYLTDENHDTYLKPPMDIPKWEERLGADYVLLIRAHYAVARALELKESSFVKDVSNYPQLNDLYAVADMMISDYSSTYFDYSILGRPMLCFAYDQEEYEKKRGLYLKLEDTLPCRVDHTEDEVLDSIQNMDIQKATEQAKAFRSAFAPYAGNASKTVVDVIVSRLREYEQENEE